MDIEQYISIRNYLRDKAYPLGCNTGNDKKKIQNLSRRYMMDKYKAAKLDDVWLGPFVVTKVNNNGTYWLIGKDQRRLQGAVNMEKLRPWYQKKSMVPIVSSYGNGLLEFTERKATR